MTMRGPTNCDGLPRHDAPVTGPRRTPDRARRWDRALAVAALGALTLAKPAAAADAPITPLPLEAKAVLNKAALQQAYAGTGLYIGGLFGAGGGSLGPGTNPLPLEGVALPHSVTGLIGGY